MADDKTKQKTNQKPNPKNTTTPFICSLRALNVQNGQLHHSI